MRESTLETEESDRRGTNETTNKFSTTRADISPSYHDLPQHNTGLLKRSTQAPYTV